MKYICSVKCGVDVQCSIEIAETRDGRRPNTQYSGLNLPCFLNVPDADFLNRLLFLGWNKCTVTFVAKPAGASTA